MSDCEKKKLGFVQILTAGACASGLVSMLGLQGITRIFAMVGIFVVVASVLQLIGKEIRDGAVAKDQSREITPDREPMD